MEAALRRTQTDLLLDDNEIAFHLQGVLLLREDSRNADIAGTDLRRSGASLEVKLCGPAAEPAPHGQHATLFVGASLGAHVLLWGLVGTGSFAAAPSSDAEATFVELAPWTEPPAAPVEELPPPLPEPSVIPPPAVAAPSPPPPPRAMAPKVTEPAPSLEPASAAAATDSSIERAGEEAAETVASSAGGLAVDRAAGAGNAGAAQGALRRRRPAVDRRALTRGWMREAQRALGRPATPRALQRTGLEGTPMVAFRVDEQGNILGVRLARSSGHELVDQAALMFARSRRQVPAPPDALSWVTREITLPIVYRVQRG